MHKKVELLAPAGNLEKLKFAFLYGADACYIGGRNYSLRANAKNFSIEEIQESGSCRTESRTICRLSTYEDRQLHPVPVQRSQRTTVRRCRAGRSVQ